MSQIKYLRSTLIFLLIFFGALEFFSFVLTKNEWLLFNDTPRIYLKSKEATGTNWRTEESEWGAWHKRNYIERHEKSCFNVTYKTNEVGARDDSFNSLKTTDTQKKKYILLGDSFAEGVGVEKDKTSESILEKLLNVDILNFGAGGSLGPVQYEIIYNEFAKKYPHDGVIIYLLPVNDFTDNDYDYWVNSGATYFKFSAKKSGERYRPYYRKISEDAYGIFYPDNAFKRVQWDYEEPSFEFKLKKFLVDHFWFSNTLLTIKQVLNTDSRLSPTTANKTYSGYFDATMEQQKAAIFFMRRLITSIEKPVVLVLIPKEEDFVRISNGEKVGNQFWYKEFLRLSKETGMTLIDLASNKPRDIGSLYSVCDGHWSEAGNEWAAKEVAAKMPRAFRKINLIK